MTDSTADTAAERWADELGGWGIPARIVDQAPESPWYHDPCRFSVRASPIDGVMNSTSRRWAAEVLPPTGGTVLDVGCGGGRSSLPLAPPASELIGVDTSGAMLDEFVRAATESGVARRTVHGAWPDIADLAPVADVVVCHHVAYNVADLVPFLVSLTAHARLAVVVELTERHPMSAWSPAWSHFWDLDRPTGPVADDFVRVVRELGIEPEVAMDDRQVSDPLASTADAIAGLRRRLCLPAERDAELAAWLADNPPTPVTRVMTLRWPGEAASSLPA